MVDTETKEQGIIASLNKSNELIGKIDLSELPAIINGQVAQINALSKKIQDAMDTASAAKTAAEKAKGESAGFGHKKKAIEELQKSGVASAEAIGETVDALQKSFEYEKQLGEISKFLIALAAFSAEHTNQTIAQLKAAVLNKGAGGSLSKEAKERLTQIIRQLEVQGETIKRQEELAQEIAEHQALLAEKDEQDDQQDVQIAQNAKTISAHGKALTTHQKENARQDREIRNLQQQDEQQDELIARNAQSISSAAQQLEAQQQKDAEHDAQIAALVQEDDQQDILIAQSMRKDAEQDRILSQMAADDEAQDAQIAENKSKNDQQDRVLSALSKADEDQDMQIAENTNKNKEQDQRLAELFEANAAQDVLIAQGAVKDEEQDAKLSNIDATNAKQGDLLQEQAATIQELKLQIEMLKNEKGNKVFMYVTAATAATTLILAILHFFI